MRKFRTAEIRALIERNAEMIEKIQEFSSKISSGRWGAGYTYDGIAVFADESPIAVLKAEVVPDQADCDFYFLGHSKEYVANLLSALRETSDMLNQSIRYIEYLKGQSD